VSVGYLYRHYKSKEALIESIVDEHFNEFKEEIRSIMTENSTFETIVEIYINQIFELFEDGSKDLQFLIVIISDSNFFLEIITKERITEKKDFLYSLYQSGIKSGCIDEEKVNFLMFISIFIMLPFSYLRKFYQLQRASLDFISRKELIESRHQLVKVCLDAIK
jgi:AcrR family transcriptional regulator